MTCLDCKAEYCRLLLMLLLLLLLLICVWVLKIQMLLDGWKDGRMGNNLVPIGVLS